MEHLIGQMSYDHRLLHYHYKKVVQNFFLGLQKEMSFDYSQEVIIDLEKALETDDGYDVIIYAGENENVKELHAHSSILCIRSQYFRSVISKEWDNMKDKKFIFKKPNISPQIFKVILSFIYCGKIDLTELKGPDILGLFMTIDELKFHTLIPNVQEYLIKHQDEFLQENPIEILEIAYQHESFKDLWDHYLEKIGENPQIIFGSDNFTSLKAPILKLLLERNYLNLDEILIWDNLLKWGIAQNPSVSQDTTKWSKEDITIMSMTLHEFVPLIRFYHISSDDFLDKIYPLKELLPITLAEELVKFNIVPDRIPNIDDIQPPRLIYNSTLIVCQHFTIFACWIDKKSNSHYDNIKDIPYNFNLLYRASRDGDTVAEFYNKCNDKGATIIVAKIANSNKIFGGYNPLQWDSSNSWKFTRESFIYFIADRKDVKTAKVSYSNSNRYSIRNLSDGPGFGDGCDLYYEGNGVWCISYGFFSSYNSIIDDMQTGKLCVDDYEVFQVIKK
ncbi:hypothetical protein RclHR1_08990003 [Rhizophagus clarus]|nr:hypothetical protein RclHR1_08990003 [Rhizophagus clarus]